MEILSCLLLQKYTNDRPAPLFFQTEVNPSYYIAVYKVVCQPSPLTHILIHLLFLTPVGFANNPTWFALVQLLGERDHLHITPRHGTARCYQILT
jgi:hypothetical protein